MPHFFFHLATPEHDFRDDIGMELSNVAAAHKRALRLINRVMLVRKLTDGPTPEWSRWVVHIADSNRRTFLSVLFPRAQTRTSRRPRLSVVGVPKPHEASR